MESWDRLVRALGVDGRELGLRAGVSGAALRDAEERLGGPLPTDYRAWLAVTDGQEPGALSILPTNGVFVPLERMVDEWVYERGFDREDDGGDTYQDDDRVRWFVYHPGRLTIAGTYFLDGDNTMLDLVPGPAGTVGQVIDLVSEVDFVVIAESLDAYFTRLAGLVERGTLVVRDRPDQLRGLATPHDDERWEHLLLPP